MSQNKGRDAHTIKRLLENHSPDETGTWVIKGEDSNADMGGHHSRPTLETVSGTFLNVCNYAVTLPQFYQWGYGGEIVKISPKKKIKNIDQIRNPKLIQLEKERFNLQERLSEIEKEISDIIYKQ